MTDAGAMERAAALVAAARRGVAFTGAGVSAESGIRTFRGEDGLWKRYDPYRTAHLQAFIEDPTVYWTVSRERWTTYSQARPNPGHVALAALEAEGHLAAVVTQNTDGLHLAAGTNRLIELHGRGATCRCLDCGATEPRADVQARLEREMPPRCRLCGGIHVKPEVVFFGEGLPAGAFAEAVAVARAADLMLVVGSSLQVQPAASLPVIAAEAGAAVVIVNEESTPADALAAAVLRGRAGEILPHLVRLASE
ncbi:MAG: Sir2 family NAD-dependent protein deacetylase [Candidatus Dormibacteraeota bacterium]|nr:Sir2 family NAD-dependent protein deacetylase [Candidatus Dormibacteraeota bacterium]